jgi:uncharacterized protein (TIGR03067 family)
MRRMLPLLAVLCLAFAPAPFPKRSRQAADDLKALQGTWVTDNGLVEARFERDRVSYYRKGALVHVYRVTLDTFAKPKAFDLAGADGRNYQGIYSLEKDTLTMYSRGPRDPRPAAFKASDEYQEVMKRKKP